ncbi:MAG: hypothetical protein ACRDHN_04915 [Thermomicrobiales bacterium]
MTIAHRRSAVYIAVLLICLASFAGIGRSAALAADEPDLRLRPNDGPIGTTSEARGRHFSPGASGSIIWDADSSELATFTANDDGEFTVSFVIPEAPAGEYIISATSGSETATDDFEITGDDSLPPSAISTTTIDSPPMLPSSPVASSCPTDAMRTVDVSDAVELTNALAAAQPGDLIRMADGNYLGTFTAAASGSASQRISLCGSRSAVIDGGDVGNGYAFHITGDYWTISGITVTNALKGVMADDADFTQILGISVHDIGHEGIHFRTNSSDNVIQDSEVYNTGIKRDKFGEGIYLGSAVSNWGNYTNGEPDRSDRNQVLRNRIWNTTSESMDIKEGTTGGLIEGNQFDGSALAGADSWVDVKGNDYIIRNNTGTNSPLDGFQTHVINDMDWGRNNTFEGNVADVNGDGYGFYIHDPETSGNIVSCGNVVNGAAKGFANQPCT